MEHFPQKHEDTDKGYERDDSRMAEEQSASSKEKAGKRRVTHELPIARKRLKTVGLKSLTDSGYERDVSSDAAVCNGRGMPVDREEETQVDVTRPIVPFSIGGYVDHSLDPDDLPEQQFAPIHRKPSFPESLVAILSNPDLSKIIEWLPHGRSFYIIDPRAFATRVLPVYFRHSNLSSFNRQLNGYGFRKIKLGPSSEKSHYHPLFLRNLPHLTKKLHRIGRSKPTEQSVMYESQLERVSAERPLPTRMSPFYANHIQTMNKHIYESLRLENIRLGSSSGGVDASSPSNEQDASSHLAARAQPAVPSVIYTPSPRPLPHQVVYTPPQPPPQSSPLSESMERQLLFGMHSSAAVPQGTVFTQSHPSFSPNPAPQNAFLPAQFMSGLPFQVQPLQGQPVNAQASSALPAPEASGQNVAQASQAAQTPQAQALPTAEEAMRQAQIQLLTNAIAAQLGKGQYFQPIEVVSNSLRVSPSVPQQTLDGIGQAQPSGLAQDLAQQSLDAISSTQLPSSSLQGLQLQSQQQWQPPQPSPQPQQPQQLQSLSNLFGSNAAYAPMQHLADLQQQTLQQPTPQPAQMQPAQSPLQTIFPGATFPGPSAANLQVPSTQPLSPALDASQLMSLGINLSSVQCPPSSSLPSYPGLPQQSHPNNPQQTAAGVAFPPQPIATPQMTNYLEQQQNDSQRSEMPHQSSQHRTDGQHTREM